MSRPDGSVHITLEAGCRATIRRRLASTAIVALGHQGAEEELVDDRPQRGDADERIRAVIDAGEAIVADVLQAGAAEGQDEPIGRLDRNLAVLDAVDEEQRGYSGIDLIGGRRPLVRGDAFAFRRAAHEAARRPA